MVRELILEEPQLRSFLAQVQIHQLRQNGSYLESRIGNSLASTFPMCQTEHYDQLCQIKHRDQVRWMLWMHNFSCVCHLTL